MQPSEEAGGLRVALAQVNTTVGDLDGNVERVLAAAERARAAGAGLLVLPELAVCGYPPKDLLDRPAFVAAQRRALDRLAARLPEGLPAIAGFVEPIEASPGRPLANAAALLEAGAVRPVHRKCLLPTYDVFDEDRWFEPAGDVGAPVTIGGVRIGVAICEDMWSDAPIHGALTRRYRDDPIAALVAKGAQVICVISASPFNRGKPAVRERIAAEHARRHRVPLLHCNLTGGNDDLIFDGRSAAFDAAGAVIARAAHCAEDLLLVDLAPAADGPLAVRALDDATVEAACGPEEEVFRALVLGTGDYVRKCGFERAIVGLSGGIDSALTATIAARALGADRVLGVAMPSRFSSQGSRDDAAALAANLGIDYRVIEIEPMFDAFLAALAPAFGGAPFDVTEENLQARIRGTVLMALSNKTGAMVLTTGNKSEMSVGYCTLYGDMCGGLAVISDVPKMLVYDLARWCNREREVIPTATIEKPPSAELRPDQTDQDSLPPYDVLDRILEGYIEEHRDPASLAGDGIDPELARDIARKVDRNEYKRKQAPPGLRVTTKAFGSGRRYPIVQRFGHEA